MIYGYARVSTTDQHLSPQLEQLQAAGCQRIMQEKASAATATGRVELQKLLTYVVKGDQIVVTKLDRLARSTQHLLTMVEQLTARGVSLRILNFGMDTGTPTGKMMLTILGAVAEFERNMMIERQRDGIERAKKEGKYKGAEPTARRQSVRVLGLLAAGMRPDAVAERCGMGVASVYRIRQAAERERRERAQGAV